MGRRILIEAQLNSYLKSLDKKFPGIPTKKSCTKPFLLKATISEAIKGLKKGDTYYAKIKLHDALERAKALNQETTKIENILNEIESPLEEEIFYTFDELANELLRLNPQKFSTLIQDLKKLPEKHKLLFSSCFFENIETAHYSKLFKNVRNACNNLYPQAQAKEKEILDLIVKKAGECLECLHPAKQQKPAIILSS